MPIAMPDLGPSIDEAQLTRWMVTAGTAVRRGDVIAEVESDKALLDIEAPADGVIGELVVEAGGRVRVGQPLARWAGEDAGLAIAVERGAPAPAESADAAGSPPDAAAADVAAAGAVVADVAATVAVPLEARREASVAAAEPAQQRVFASPLARRLARQHQLDLARRRGSGPNGRIIKRDIERWLAEAPAPAPAAASDSALAQSVLEPHSAMRRTIANRLTEAKRDIPHFYLTIDCDVGALLALRAQLKETSPDLLLSINDLVVKAAALALAETPSLNVHWTEEGLRRLSTIDVATAVATPGGLVTPVLREADRKSLRIVSAELRALAERGRLGRLRPEEYRGGGITVSNLGMHGIREFAAIINPPQAAILAVGSVEPRPVVRDGQIVAATLMTCTLSADHRAVDGATAAAYLAAFRRFIERPLALLL